MEIVENNHTENLSKKLNLSTRHTWSTKGHPDRDTRKKHHVTTTWVEYQVATLGNIVWMPSRRPVMLSLGDLF